MRILGTRYVPSETSDDHVLQDCSLNLKFRKYQSKRFIVGGLEISFLVPTANCILHHTHYWSRQRLKIVTVLVR